MPASPLARMGQYVLAGLCVVPILWVLADYPLSPWLLAAAVATYAALLWRRPGMFLVVLPAIIPNLDLGLWTGWTTIASPDLFVLATLAVLILRTPPSRADLVPRGLVLGVLALLIAAYGIGLTTGLLSPLGYNGHSDNPYLRPDNALRLIKGPMEALVLLPFLRQRHRLHGDAPLWLGRGFAVGLAFVTMEVMLERALFVGLADFTTDYRVVGPFTSMRIGGGHIGAYTALALPFVLTLGPRRGRWFLWPIFILVGLGGAYTLAVTFARTAYMAALGGGLTVAFGLLLATRRGRTTWSFAVVPIALLIAVLTLAASSDMMRKRFGTLAEDLVTREMNWQEGWAVRDPGLVTDVFGMGLGTYQRAMRSRSKVNRPSNLSVEADTDGPYVSLRAVTPLYLGQKIARPDVGTVRLSLRFRSTEGTAVLGYILCDKVLLYSENCRGGQAVPAHPGSWETLTVFLSAEGLGGGILHGLVHRPVELALFTSIGNTVAFRDVRLEDAAGRALLANGDFTHGLDRWLFTDDDHLAWRIKDQYLMLLFETGALGLLAYLSTCALALAGGLRSALRGNAMGAVVAGSVVAFLISGISDDLLEAPKLATLFFLVCWAGMLLWEEDRRG